MSRRTTLLFSSLLLIGPVTLTAAPAAAATPPPAPPMPASSTTAASEPAPAATGSTPTALAASCATGYWCGYKGGGFTGSVYRSTGNVKYFSYFNFEDGTNVDNHIQSIRQNSSGGKNRLQLYWDGGYGRYAFCVNPGSSIGSMGGYANNMSSSMWVAGRSDSCY